MSESTNSRIEERQGGEILSVAEAADFFRVDPQTIKAMIRNRKLPFAMVGRMYRIRREDLYNLFKAS